MSDILCVTNRALCREDFLARLEKIAAARPAGIILREKDLPEGEYRRLAEQALRICGKYGTNCILHSFAAAAAELGARSVHLPLPVLREMSGELKAEFAEIGASCHSAEDAREAQRLGCTYITAGHVFETDCKRGIPGRGLDFVRKVCKSVDIPVYAIGGISPENIAAVREAGAAGACVMSGIMRCDDVNSYVKNFGRVCD
jgi:thiamine-phosphate pyrophosphorylase